MDPLTQHALSAQGGDPAASSAFIRESQADVWRLCAHLVDTASADDLTQDTYLRAFRALPQFRAESSARTWVLAIARRTCHDELRARTRRRRRDALAIRLSSQSGHLPDPAEAVTTQALLHRLEDSRRTAFVLTQLLGLSYEEAAAVCECPIGTIRSRVARARADLVELLNATESANATPHNQEIRNA
jgi:RNA polymerase sigma-70 factor (ECF subfamily)